MSWTSLKREILRYGAVVTFFIRAKDIMYGDCDASAHLEG